MPKDIVVVDLGKPKFLLLGFFLHEEGFSVRECGSIEDGEVLLQASPGDAVVLNTVAYPDEVARAVHRFRQVSSDVRVVTMHFGRHSDVQQPARAHLCIHGPVYVDDLIAPLMRFLDLEPRYQ